MSEKPETEGSVNNNELSCVFSHNNGKIGVQNLGKGISGYTNKSKRKTMFERLIHNQVLDISKKQIN